MYNIFKMVISSGNYELTGILKKIDVQWVQGSLTDEERAELILFAQNSANVQNSIDVIKKLEEFDKRLSALENAKSDTDTDTSNVEYADFVVGKWYYNGDAIRFEGNNYVCTAPEGQVCVWSPIDYPAYWELV